MAHPKSASTRRTPPNRTREILYLGVPTPEYRACRRSPSSCPMPKMATFLSWVIGITPVERQSVLTGLAAASSSFGSAERTYRSGMAKSQTTMAAASSIFHLSLQY